jgi:hypothetical protein
LSSGPPSAVRAEALNFCFVPGFASFPEQTLQIETFVPVSGLFSEQTSIGITDRPYFSAPSPNHLNGGIHGILQLYKVE